MNKTILLPTFRVAYVQLLDIFVDILMIQLSWLQQFHMINALKNIQDFELMILTRLESPVLY